jgi:hypothetical protein
LLCHSFAIRRDEDQKFSFFAIRHVYSGLAQELGPLAVVSGTICRRLH